MTIKTSTLTAGTFVRITYGRGTQTFLVEQVSAKGKVTGQRFFATGNGWTKASLAIDDYRIIEILDAKPAGMPAPLEIAQTRRQIEDARAETWRRSRPVKVSIAGRPAMETNVGAILDSCTDEAFLEDVDAVARGWEDEARTGGGSAPRIIVTQSDNLVR